MSEHEYETDTVTVYQALLNACGGDYNEASRRIMEGNKILYNSFFLISIKNFNHHFNIAKEKISKMD